MKFTSLTRLFLFTSILTANAQNPVNKKEFITVGGIEQWITIKGEDSSKPVILFIHGGPGSTMTPYADNTFAGWEKDFILVQWDQRGAGRTYGKNAPAEQTAEFFQSNPLTIAQMTAEGIEVAEYLIEYLHKKKVILTGTSWGSALAAKMALKRPDLFYAYVGHSQMVNPSEDIVAVYKMTYEMAKETGDQQSVETLESLGEPPYDQAKSYGKLLRVVKKYEAANSTPAPEDWWKVVSEYDNEEDGKARYEGDDYSFINYAGHAPLGIKPMMDDINFLKEGLEFKIPVYFIQGEADILTSKEFTKPYFDQLKAPKKELFLVPDAAHGFNESVINVQYKIIVEKVLPIIGK